MDILQQLEIYNNEIYKLEKAFRDAMRKRIDWCKEKRAEFKKLYPEKGEILQIIDIKTASRHRVYCDLDENPNEIYFFRVTDPRFVPHRDFEDCYGVQMPTVKGQVLDSNLKKIAEADIYITRLKKIEKENDPSKYANRLTYVYVMIDKNTGYYKIGRSKKPEYRERTLQSEKPTIEILYTFEAMIKHEKQLHEMFSNKRLRGEWFDLSGSDIEKIKTFFSNEMPTII